MPIDFTIQISDDMIEPLIKQTVSAQLNMIIRDKVNKQVTSKINELSNKIEKSVEIYLAKRMTDKEISTIIDDAVKQIIEDKLRENSY